MSGRFRAALGRWPLVASLVCAACSSPARPTALGPSSTHDPSVVRFYSDRVNSWREFRLGGGLNVVVANASLPREAAWRFGAGRDGKLAAIVHEAWGQTSTYEEYAEVTLDPARAVYSCPDVATHYRLVEMNINSPCPMRAPGTATGILALEMAMDEMAEQLGLDPIEFRLHNDADRDEDKDLPWSSKELRACYAMGAERFGWSHRSPVPGRNRKGSWLVGHGMATAFYPSHRAPASAQAVLYANGSAVVRTAASDMGPGTYTAMTQIAADALGLPIERVHFELGDTDMPKAPVHGGSITLASVGNAVAAACQAVRRKLTERAGEDGDPTALMRRLGLEKMEAEGQAAPGDETKTYSSSAFGAVFVEVAVGRRDVADGREPRAREQS